MLGFALDCLEIALSVAFAHLIELSHALLQAARCTFRYVDVCSKLACPSIS